MSTNQNLMHFEEQILPKYTFICIVPSLQYFDLFFFGGWKQIT